MSGDDGSRVWVSIVDPSGDRTWVFDAAFLRSNYRCIWGEGCQGVLDEPARERQQGCCSYGAEFVDDDDVQTVVRAFVQLRPEHMQFHDEAAERGFLRPGVTDDGHDATFTRVVDGACIFFNRPGFEGGTGCALHLAAAATGERPLDWKPNVCWQLPIRVDHAIDEHGDAVSHLRAWTRRDWGTDAELAWWCTEAPEAFRSAEPVYVSARDEIVELVGDEVYERLVEALEDPGWVPLANPVVRSDRPEAIPSRRGPSDET